MKLSISQLLQCVTLVLVICRTSTATSTSFNANYDDLSAPIAIGAVPVATYKDLIYNSWVIRPDNASVLGGFAPHSPPNTILTSAFTQAINGTPSFIVAPPYTSARFESFYFACNVQTRENVVDESAQCTITVTAFQKSSNKETAIASYTASPPLNLLGRFAMVQAVLPDTFESVYKVTVVQDSPSTQALAIDNLVYTIFR